MQLVYQSKIKAAQVHCAMSDTPRPTPTFDETLKTLQDIKNLLHHGNRHVLEVAVKIKEFHDDCEVCRAELNRFVKLSDEKQPVELKGKASAHITMTTPLCFQGMHKECAKDYVMSNELIAIICNCTCHEATKNAKKKKERHRGKVRSRELKLLTSHVQS
ncbi:MAG: hypothetical protein AB1351_07930 [Thermoproteota archaeon]